MFSMSGSGGFAVQHFEPDTTVEGSKMFAAEIVFLQREVEPITCIVRNVIYGKLEKLSTSDELDIGIMIFPQLRPTKHTRAGFVSVQFTTKPVQFNIYVHHKNLKMFFESFTQEFIRSVMTEDT